MNNRWVALAGITAFGVTLAIVVGSRMESTGAMALAMGIAVGVVAGVAVGLLVALPQRGTSRSSGSVPDDQNVIVLPPDQAQTLIKLLTSRRQASPEDFPMVADRERSISTVGGANIDFSDED
ncbi:MAG: hypothetical protein JXJ17_04240 [Anaerolineae bacterium]|nr:hypothetical protein [Anaerolineae bacterium]